MKKLTQIHSDVSPEERGALAEKFFNEGYNCSQSVVLAFSDIIEEAGGPSSEQLSAIMSGFGGGFGRMREVCGTVSGMTAVVGMACPAPAASHSEDGAASAEAQSAKKANYALVQECAAEFREMNGSIICRELLGLSPHSSDGPVPSERTEAYYKKRPCGELCRIAATIVANKISR